MHEKNVFITGIHTGLGNALAGAFLDRGREVFAVSRRRPEELSARDRLHFRSLDLSKLEGIPDAVRQLLAPVGRLDLVLLNAGVLGRIRSALGTERMQTTSQAAERLLDVLPRLLEHPSGSYVDVRDMQ